MERSELLDERIKKLNEEAKEDFLLTDYTIKEKALASPNIKIKWTCILAEEQKLLKVLEEKQTEYKGELMSKKFDVNVAQFKKELAIDGDPGIAKFKKAIENQKDIIRFVEGVLKIAHGFGFDIKNSVDILKLEQ